MVEPDLPDSGNVTGEGGTRARRAARLAALGALAGLAWTIGSVVQRPTAALPVDAIARVNDTTLARADWARSFEALALDRNQAPGPADGRHVLDRMIDEELLVQRGLALGLVRHDRRLRADLVQAVLASISAEVESAPIDEAALRSFFAAHGDEFTSGARLRVASVFVDAPPGEDPEPRRARAETAARALRAGDDVRTVQQRHGDSTAMPLPDALLPLEKLQDYLGPTAARVAADLPAGAVSDPIRVAGGFVVLRLVERRTGDRAPLEAIRPQVETEFRRRAGEQAVRDYLTSLRDQAVVVIAPDLP